VKNLFPSTLPLRCVNITEMVAQRHTASQEGHRIMVGEWQRIFRCFCHSVSQRDLHLYVMPLTNKIRNGNVTAKYITNTNIALNSSMIIERSNNGALELLMLRECTCILRARTSIDYRAQVGAGSTVLP
jgi:hypothetical protein